MYKMTAAAAHIGKDETGAPISGLFYKNPSIGKPFPWTLGRPVAAEIEPSFKDEDFIFILEVI